MSCLHKIELGLKSMDYLAGDEVSLADLVLATCLRPLFMTVLGTAERKNNQRLCEWIDRIYKSV